MDVRLTNSEVALLKELVAAGEGECTPAGCDRIDRESSLGAMRGHRNEKPRLRGMDRRKMQELPLDVSVERRPTKFRVMRSSRQVSKMVISGAFPICGDCLQLPNALRNLYFYDVNWIQHERFAIPAAARGGLSPERREQYSNSLQPATYRKCTANWEGT